MKDCINTRLTAGSWTEISTEVSCSFYSIKSDQSDVSFKIKKLEDDEAYWTVDPDKNGEQAKLTISSSEDMTGTLFFLQAVSQPVDIEIFLG